MSLHISLISNITTFACFILCVCLCAHTGPYWALPRRHLRSFQRGGGGGGPSRGLTPASCVKLLLDRGREARYCHGLCLVLGDTGQGAPGHQSGLGSRQGAWGAVWAEGTEGGCAQRLESAGPLREAGPRLGWADGRASSDLLSDILAIRLGERGGTQPERALWPQPGGVAHEENRTHTQGNVSRRGDQLSRVGTAVAALP